MTLDYSYLSEVFPDFPTSPRQTQYRDIIQIPPPAYQQPIEKILDLQPGEKLRIVNGYFEIERRSFSSIYRKYTGDSRWKILEKILQINKSNVREFYLDILRTSTYSRDKSWIEASKNLKKQL
jgi:hypothetical protein